MSKRLSVGFTLVELITVVAVVAILAAIAFPSFQATIRMSRVATANNALMAAVSEARSEAIRNTRGAALCGSRTATGCDGTFSDGWLIYADLDSNGDFSSGDTVIRFERPSAGLTFTGSSEVSIAFDARGRRRSSTDQAIVLQATNCGGDALRRTLTVMPTGQVRLAKGACS